MEMEIDRPKKQPLKKLAFTNSRCGCFLGLLRRGALIVDCANREDRLLWQLQ
jgi:hypothetical protein